MIKKEEILKFSQNDNDKMFLSRIYDYIQISENRNIVKFSDFLDEYQLSLAILVCEHFNIKYSHSGGYESALRQILCILPDYMESTEVIYPLSYVKVTGYKLSTLSHRDYLGTLMALGIKRECIGDILPFDDNGIIIVQENIADYIVNQVDKIAKNGVKCCITAKSDFSYIPKFQCRNIVVSSLRFDLLVSEMCNISRSESKNIIVNGDLKVNFTQQKNPSKVATNDDIFSIKGYGRFAFDKINYTTKKDKLNVTIKKYI